MKLFELMWFGFNGPFNECSGKNNYKTFLKLNFCEPQVINEEFQGNFCTFFPISRIKHFQADAISIIRHFYVYFEQAICFIFEFSTYINPILVVLLCYDVYF